FSAPRGSLLPEPPDSPPEASLFKEGDFVLLIDRKARRRLVTLSATGVVHSHMGVMPHSDLIGTPEGTMLRTAGGGSYLAVRPTLGDFILSMGRTATPIYPKDLGAIITYADIYPGATVVEGGTGSGALTLALLRAVGERGSVVSYDIRPEFAAKALKNVRAFAGPELSDRLTLKEANLYDGIDERSVDRMVFDVPEPWNIVPHAAEALRPGGIFCCFLPTTLQLHRVSQALDGSAAFGMLEQFEIIMRPWDSGPMTMRPAHRMVAHTGFVTVARRLTSDRIATRIEHDRSSEDESPSDGDDTDESD
ncbi:MAG: tRNA (adenine-N1)-methyltransferase, partial [Chloroflexi bacterium]|nr:tRNA (adenine-N1)-methyltransferase [Chloroflexota bacterium]